MKWFKWYLMIVVFNRVEIMKRANENIFKKYLFINNVQIFTAIITNLS